MPKVQILNARFDAVTLTETVNAVFQQVDSGMKGWLCTVNVAILMMMRTDFRLKAFIDRATLVVADGQPIVWCAPWLGKRLPERVTGVDLVDAICERAASTGKSVYLLGATAETVEQLAKRLTQRHPNLKIDYADGYFKSSESAERADRIRVARSDILFVGMGVPRQEVFIEEQWSRLGVSVAVGVGGSFDVLAGLRARAPRWVQRIGMEWFFRLAQEPRRLFARYLITNSKFVWLVFFSLLRRALPK